MSFSFDPGYVRRFCEMSAASRLCLYWSRSRSKEVKIPILDKIILAMIYSYSYSRSQFGLNPIKDSVFYGHLWLPCCSKLSAETLVYCSILLHTIYYSHISTLNIAQGLWRINTSSYYPFWSGTVFALYSSTKSSIHTLPSNCVCLYQISDFLRLAFQHLQNKLPLSTV